MQKFSCDPKINANEIDKSIIFMLLLIIVLGLAVLLNINN